MESCVQVGDATIIRVNTNGCDRRHARDVEDQIIRQIEDHWLPGQNFIVLVGVEWHDLPELHGSMKVHESKVNTINIYASQSATALVRNMTLNTRSIRLID